MVEKEEIYRDVRFSHGAIQLLQVVILIGIKIEWCIASGTFHNLLLSCQQSL